MTVVGIEPHRDFEAYHIHLELGEPDESGIAEYDYWYDVQSLRLLGASLGGDRIESQCDGGPLFPFVEATYRCETRLDGSLVESKTKTYVIDGWEEEVVPAGRFPSVRFHEVDAEDPSIVLQSGAYSPKTGFLVRHASQGSEEFLLESWTPGP